jgi:hypothetical protein
MGYEQNPAMMPNDQAASKHRCERLHHTSLVVCVTLCKIHTKRPDNDGFKFACSYQQGHTDKTNDGDSNC